MLRVRDGILQVFVEAGDFRAIACGRIARGLYVGFESGAHFDRIRTVGNGAERAAVPINFGFKRAILFNKRLVVGLERVFKSFLASLCLFFKFFGFAALFL